MRSAFARAANNFFSIATNFFVSAETLALTQRSACLAISFALSRSAFISNSTLCASTFSLAANLAALMLAVAITSAARVFAAAARSRKVFTFADIFADAADAAFEARLSTAAVLLAAFLRAASTFLRAESRDFFSASMAFLILSKASFAFFTAGATAVFTEAGLRATFLEMGLRAVFLGFFAIFFLAVAIAVFLHGFFTYNLGCTQTESSNKAPEVQ